MYTIRRHLTASVLLTLGLAGVVAGLTSETPADEAPAPGLSPTEFTRLCRELDLKNQPWSGIPWKVSVTEARQLAAKEHKPIFLVVNTGNCLGWT
jgi:hypothetical protein